jgi:hypothetical protein
LPISLTATCQRHRYSQEAERERGQRQKTYYRSNRKKLTQSRLRPISPFSYVGQGRKGAELKRCIMLGMAPARRVIRGGCLGFLIRVILRPSAVGFWSFVRRFAVPFLCFCAFSRLLMPSSSLCGLVSLADIAKGGDGAKSVLREIFFLPLRP